MPATYAIDARHYYQASTLTTPHYTYDRDTTEYGKNIETNVHGSAVQSMGNANHGLKFNPVF